MTRNLFQKVCILPMHTATIMSLTIYSSKALDKIIKGCIKHDSRAQQALYERFSPVMFAVCLRYVKDTAEAEDVLLRSFMKVFEHISKYRSDGSFEGWIRRIVVNEALMYLRANKTLHMTVDVEQAYTVGTVQGDHLEAEDLFDMVKKLPVGYRTVFNLYAIEGYAHAEIADMLNISEGTSKSQLSRAKQLLRTMIEQQDSLNEQTSL